MPLKNTFGQDLILLVHHRYGELYSLSNSEAMDIVRELLRLHKNAEDFFFHINDAYVISNICRAVKEEMPELRAADAKGLKRFQPTTEVLQSFAVRKLPAVTMLGFMLGDIHMFSSQFGNVIYQPEEIGIDPVVKKYLLGFDLMVQARKESQ